jgi:hypothetical protein
MDSEEMADEVEVTESNSICNVKSSNRYRLRSQRAWHVIKEVR